MVGRESDENPDRRLEVRSAKRIERRVLETKELKKRSWGGQERIVTSVLDADSPVTHGSPFSASWWLAERV